MTRMIPATPARSVTRSEREVFEFIRGAKGSGEFYCLHSVGLARHLRKSYPEWSLDVVCDAESKSDFSSYIQRLSRHTRERELVGGRQYSKPLSLSLYPR